MTRLALTKNRLPDLSFGKQPHRATKNSSGYRFGRNAAGGFARGVRALFRAMLQGLVAARMRRLRTELQFRRQTAATRPMFGDQPDVRAPAEH